MRRWLILTALLLLAGMIVSVAVAWGCAVWVDGLPLELVTSGDSGESHREQPRWSAAVTSNYGSTVIQYGYSSRARAPAPLRPDASRDETDAWLDAKRRFDDGLPSPAFGEPAEDVVALPRWSRATVRPDPDRDENTWWLEDARGWPRPCLVSFERGWTQGGIPQSEGSWRIELNGGQGPLGLTRALPLRPLWPGLIIDSIFYAAVLLLVGAGTRRLLRRFRTVRGVCPKCGYPIGTSAVCTECGSALPATPARPEVS